MLTTTKRRHCDKEAALRPKPNLPRSSLSLLSKGLLLPYLIASYNSSFDIPHPLSNITIQGSADGSDKIDISSAFALILLSIKSAIAEEKEYPNERIDSINDGANGTQFCSYILFPPISTNQTIMVLTFALVYIYTTILLNPVPSAAEQHFRPVDIVNLCFPQI